MQLQDLPSVDALSRRLAGEFELPAVLVVESARRALDIARATLRDGGEDIDPHALASVELAGVKASRHSRVINASGVLLHTNLGRAPLHPDAAAAASDVASGYSNVEFDVETGRRGRRGAYARRLLTGLTGAEAAAVVNNNAGALMLALAALGGGSSVVVSRGELVEIGGSFRLPELMAASGAILTEVGTTNRTRAADYETAAARAALILKVHPSNYRIDGFAESVDYGTLAGIAHRAGIPFVADVGSGLLDTRVPWLGTPPPRWLQEEPGVKQTLDAGADVVIFSGDKLLGGPQAGIAVGRADLIDRMDRHPLARALRTDGPTDAALAVTLELYGRGRGAEIPFWRMASIEPEELRERHERLLSASGLGGRIVDSTSIPGAGSVPGLGIPSPAIVVEVPAELAWAALVEHHPPIIARRTAEGLVIDLRTVEPADDQIVLSALEAISTA